MKSIESSKDGGLSTGIEFAFDQPTEINGKPILICDGVWWIPLPIESSLEYVNVYALRDGSNLTLIDTGTNTLASSECLKRALQSQELNAYKLNRVIVTHYHPDHIGCAGSLAKQGVELWMSRTCWLQATLLIETTNLLPSEAEVDFMRMAGMQGIELEAFKRQSSNRYSSLVDPLPTRFTPLSEGQVLKIGERLWTVHVGNGHAAEHLTLWTDDMVILGDQVLPVTASNLTVPYSEPEADVVDEWLRSCDQLSVLANNKMLCLPGHNRPFRGLSNRIKQLQNAMISSIERLRKLVVRSTTAIECLERFQGEGMSANDRRRRLPELFGFMTYLVNQGQLERKRNDSGVAIFKRVVPTQMPGTLALNSSPQIASSKPQAKIRTIADINDSSGADDSGKFVVSIKHQKTTRGRKALVAAGLLASLAGGLYFFRDTLNKFGSSLFEENSSPELVSNPVLNLASTTRTYVEVIEVRELKAIQLPRKFAGTIRPHRASEIGFNRIGMVSAVLAERGQTVAAGTVLAKLNTDSLEAALATIRAKREAAEAQLAELIAGPRKQTVQSATNQVNSAIADYELAKSTSQRLSRLVQIGGASKQDLENALTNFKAKEEMLQVARNSLSELQEGTRPEQIAAQRAVLKEIQASEGELMVQLKESTIVAPFRGVVADRFLENGGISSPGVPILRIVEADAPEAWVGISPEYVSKIQDVKTHELVVQGVTYQGTVKAILPELDKASRTKTVVFEIKTDRGPELFGQSVSVEVYREVNDRGFWLPQSALVKGDQGLWGVYALEPSQSPDDENQYRLKKSELEILQVDSDRVYARGTLKEGDKIVSVGVQRLTPGQTVYLAKPSSMDEPAVGLSSDRHASNRTRKN